MPCVTGGGIINDSNELASEDEEGELRRGRTKKREKEWNGMGIRDADRDAGMQVISAEGMHHNR